MLFRTNAFIEVRCRVYLFPCCFEGTLYQGPYHLVDPVSTPPPPQVCHRDVDTEKRLRKDLKRTKALLADAQIMLDHMKNNAPSKREIAQLKNQVQYRSSPPLLTYPRKEVHIDNWET